MLYLLQKTNSNISLKVVENLLQLLANNILEL